MRGLLLVLGATVIAAPALAVGFGPLRKEGVVAGPSKAFHLTIVNPYEHATDFVVQPYAMEDDVPETGVRIFPAQLRLGARQSRRLVAIIDDLEIGKMRWVRVCAERAVDPEGAVIHARVCSRLGARRLAAVRG